MSSPRPHTPSQLFANQRETNLTSTLALIEEVLGELGHDAAASRFPTISKANNPRHAEIKATHAWRIRRGSAITRVLLVDRANFTHLRVVAVVMTLDANVDRAALFAHLLELNAGLCGAAFASEGD